MHYSYTLKIKSKKFLVLFVAFIFSIICSDQGALSHEIPNDVVVRTIIKPDEDKINLLIRVPLEAMRDINFPTTGPGYLELEKMPELTMDAAEIWLGNFIDVYEEKNKIKEWQIEKTRISLPSDRSFGQYNTAYNSMFSPSLNNTLIHYRQALLDVLITYPIESASSKFSADINFGGLGINTTTIMTFVSTDDVSRLYQFKGSPGLVELDPSWLNAFFRFVSSGVEHIFMGIDHLLFILCLILPCRRIRSLIIVITAFTVAHSITLVASALGTVPSGLWFPPFVETFIAFSILYMAIENILKSEQERRWPMVFIFGLLHGFGFSFALSETMQFAGSHLITSLLAFNLGVELGQIIIICITVPIINLVFQWTEKERILTVIASVIVAHTAWHWMLDRYEAMQAYNYSGFLDHSGSTIINWVIVSFVTAFVYLILRRLFIQIME
tara:strand:+ start:52 stop:1377 length:1326 start_codon:yes stop_codon:yes gene_type:complete